MYIHIYFTASTMKTLIYLGDIPPPGDGCLKTAGLEKCQLLKVPCGGFHH